VCVFSVTPQAYMRDQPPLGRVWVAVVIRGSGGDERERRVSCGVYVRGEADLAKCEWSRLLAAR